MFSSLLVFSLMVSGTGQTSNEAPAPAAAKPVEEKKICRDSDDSTSRLAKRICRTAKEWEEARESGPKAGVRSGTPSN